MSIPFGHQQLHNRYCFEGKLELITPLRISSGIASDDTDAPFMRMFDETPYIPGSSLRGSIRSEVERIIATVGDATGLRSCTLFEKGDCAEKVRDFIHELEEKGDDEQNNKTKDERIAEFAEEELCDVCKLFGSTVYASRLIFEDAQPVSGEIHNRIRDGVGIDRDTGAARDGAKFDYEVIEPSRNGPFFGFKMVAENVSGQDKKIINLILGLLKHGLYVGGKRAGGLGKIRLTETDNRICNVTGFENPQSLWEALVSGKEIYEAIDWKEGIQC